ncbi:uncharacterized protein B0J16DRAFT_179499 [Fusarium flagelliforme]|uniref:Uncharacterized protein n=1 Tax=Fusarium flagelliforme TaxID=2675880 RepID=A0A395MW71_9HYPO|nr:uncharacterized protein B0J16DRAFT_179499 [Fusarium flagelliforme]KAH7180004.1 hypothetical protein B0J16DRAFT_179499 [Fusarium flagelliforme]RFN51895.1 hypothetical protein FIE12Z_3856 [Fusarium flagelliforme]
MARRPAKPQACPNARWSCITESWEGARRNVEGFPNKDHQAFPNLDQAYAYMDKRGCPRPHNFVTDAQASKIDPTSKVPDGWNVEVWGPYRYDPDEMQTFDPPIERTAAEAPSHHRPYNKSRFLPGRRRTKCDEMQSMACELRRNDGPLKLEMHGAFNYTSPEPDIHATVRALIKSDLAMVLQTLATMAPSPIANPEPGALDLPSYGLRPTFKKESPRNDQAPTIKQEPSANHQTSAINEKPLINEPAPAMHNDAALSHKLFIAGTPPLPDDDFHHDPPSYEDDDSCSNSGSDLSSDYDSSDDDEQMDEAADHVREPCQSETSDSSSAPSSQETAEVASTPPSSPIRRRRSDADDGTLDEPPSKKACSSSIAVQPDVVTHIKSEDTTQSADHLVAQYESDSASDSSSGYDSDESQSDEPPESETNLHIETLHYSVAGKMDCLRELVSLLRKPDGVDLSISGTELATSANGTGKGTVPSAFHGKSLKTADYGKVRVAVIDLFKHYSTIVVRSERMVDVVVL